MIVRCQKRYITHIKSKWSTAGIFVKKGDMKKEILKLSVREGGQAIVLITLAMMMLVSLTGLAIDGSRAFVDRRSAQIAADNAVLAAAMMYQAGTELSEDAAFASASANGYSNDGVQNRVELTTSAVSAGCPGGQGIDFRIDIDTTQTNYFGTMVGVNQFTNRVSATSRRCFQATQPLFNGNAVVGLNPFTTSYDSGASASAKWTLAGGGIFANKNGNAKNASAVTFTTPGACLTAVGTTNTTWGCTPNLNQTDKAILYTYNAIRGMVPYPSCPAAAVARIVNGKITEAIGYEGMGTNVASWAGDYNPGVYCINNVTGNIHTGITGDGVTFYLRGTVDYKFNGGGYIGATAPTSGPFKGILILGDPLGAAIPDSPLPNNTACSQRAEFRGNGSALSQGLIFLPAACVDFRGNSNGDLQRTQLVGYSVTSNGNASVAINYNADDNVATVLPGNIQLIR